MDDSKLIEALTGLATGNICDADPAVRAMDAAIRPLYAAARLVGRARTAASPPGQNAAIHRAIAAARPGDVLVVEAGGSRQFGAFGDIMASACRLQGIAGLVIDGSVRDVAEIRSLDFPVFCLGASPRATRKSAPGEIGTEVRCGGIPVAPGDIIVGDDDGVVVIPRAGAQRVASSALAVCEREKKILEELAAGRTTCEILDIPE